MDVTFDHVGDATHVPLPAERAGTLTERFGILHRQMLKMLPEIDQVSWVLYDADSGMLRSFVDSSEAGVPLRRYEFPLAESPSLSRLVANRTARILDDIPVQTPGPSVHATHIRTAGFRSSYTVPLFDGELFQGILFFNSMSPGAFTPDTVSRLDVHVRLLHMLVTQELTAARALVGSVRVARDFARLRDNDTGSHLDRISRYARLIARHISPRHKVSDEFVELVFLFAAMHDIGKVGIPDAILHKPTELTREEREDMARHVDLGMQIIDRLIEEFHLGSLAGIDVLRNIVGSHHEFLDGSGYPKGLRGDQIPLEARIVTVADIFDALSSDRPYKPAWTLEQALEALANLADTGKIDPECVAALHAERESVADIMARYGER